MLIFSRPVVGVVLVAVAAGAYGYERLSPANPSRSGTAPRTRRVRLPSAAVVATATPTAPAAVEAPARTTSAQQAGFEAWL